MGTSHAIKSKLLDGLPSHRDTLGSQTAHGCPRYLPIMIAEPSVGLYVFDVIAAALYGLERSGTSQRVDIPMFETMPPRLGTL